MAANGRIAGVSLTGRIPRGTPFYSIQSFNGRWRELGRFTGLDSDAKKLAAHYSRVPEFSAVRVRVGRRTIHWFQRGKQLQGKVRSVVTWPDGSREWLC